MVPPDLEATMKSVCARSICLHDLENGGGVGRIEHMQPRAGRQPRERLAQHLRREAAAAHAQQHDVAEASGTYLVAERPSVVAAPRASPS